MSITEEQYRQHTAHKQRQARIAQKAVKPKPDPVKDWIKRQNIPIPAPIDPTPTKDDVLNWIERQRELHSSLLALLPVKTDGKPEIKAIQREVCAHYGISLKDMLSERRQRKLAFPRQVAVYLVRRLTTASFPDIGRRFGGRDHTTMLHADTKITRLLETDEQLKASVEMLVERLGGDPE
jgi:hypothetical protein